MKTKIVAISDKTIKKDIVEAGEIIKSGGLVAFPTETVYGLGGDAFNPLSSKKIYAAKGRPSDNPLIVHIAELSDLEKVAVDIPENGYRLAKEFWPGPLTMIFNKTAELPHETTGGLDTVAVRMPDNEIALEFIKASTGFVAAPSANKSGRPSPTLAKYVIEDLDGLVEMIIDGGDSYIGLESTIVDLTVTPPMILRPGYITKEDLERVLGEGNVSIDKTILDSSSKEAPKAPGMKYRHYAPKAEMTLVSGNIEKVKNYINTECENIKNKNMQTKTGVIATDETCTEYRADVIKSIGSRKNEASIARNLFRILREFDDENVEFIFSESFSSEGISQATMNRMLKAAGHKEVVL